MSRTTTAYQALIGIGISRSYASEIVSGVREPGIGTALRIYRETGLRFGKLKDASARDIAAMERLLGESD